MALTRFPNTAKNEDDPVRGAGKPEVSTGDAGTFEQPELSER